MRALPRSPGSDTAYLRLHRAEPESIEACRLLIASVRVQSEHDGADFDGSDTGFQIELDGERLARIFEWLDMRQESSCVEIDGMSACRRHDRDAGFAQMIDDVSCRQ